MNKITSILALAITCVLLGLGTTSSAQYCLTVEATSPAASNGTTYKFYVNMEDPTDRMSAVFGNNITPLVVNAPDGVYNSTFNASWNASGINPAFLVPFPELADDSYATIGLIGPASMSGIANAADPSLVEDADQPISPFFIANNSTALLSNTLTGASYYVLNTAGNGLPDTDGRVLIMQVTTTGSVSGSMNYQIFPLGVGNDQIQVSVDFSGAGDFCAGGAISGCMDQAACNYNASATEDDGSCAELDECGECGGTGIAEGACDCDGNILDECGICGGSGAIYECGCSGVTLVGDCDCDGNQLDALGICGGNCDSDVDGNGVCDNAEIAGCVDTAACNYSEHATQDDGSCDYCSCLQMSGDYTLTVEATTLLHRMERRISSMLIWLTQLTE